MAQTRMSRNGVRRLAAAGMVAPALALAACGSGSSAAGNGTAGASASGGQSSAAQSSAAEKVLIGISFWSQDQKRYPFEAKEMTKQAQANGDEVIVNYANNSAATQASQVEAMMQRGIKVLIIDPLDPKASAATVTKAQAAGIKVITYDIEVVGAKPDYHIGRFNPDLGTAHADAALKAVPSGKYALIRGDEATEIAHVIGKPYDEKLKGNSAINVVYDVWTPAWSAANAQKEAEAALQKNPDIKAVVAMWDEAAQSVVSALKAAGKKPGDVFVTGTDASTPSLKYIAQGWQGMSVWTPIDEMARDSVNIAHAFGTGAAAPAPDDTVDGVPQDYVKLTTVTKDNLCDFITNVAPEGWVSVQEVYGTATCA